MKHEITALKKVCLMYFLLTPPSSAKKKFCFKFKELSQEQRLTPALFKLTSLPPSNRSRARKENIKNCCTQATGFSWQILLIHLSSCFHASWDINSSRGSELSRAVSHTSQFAQAQNKTPVSQTCSWCVLWTKSNFWYELAGLITASALVNHTSWGSGPTRIRKKT